VPSRRQLNELNIVDVEHCLPARKRLPDRRGSVTFDFGLHGVKFTATAGWFSDGSFGEVFLTNHKAGSAAGIMASDAAIAASLALQHGCSPDTLRKALCRDARGNASSPLGVALDILAADEGARDDCRKQYSFGQI
jgi:hypothetical protein